MIPTGDRFPDALVKGIENIPGFDDTAKAVILPYDDAAIMAIMNAIVELDLRTITRQG